MRRIDKLQPHHDVEAFDCGQEALNRFLSKHALQNQHSGGAQSYVGLVEETVIGYYALAVGSAELEHAPKRVKKGLARHSIPIMLLARLAVDLRWQKQGVCAALLKDAMLRTLQAARLPAFATWWSMPKMRRPGHFTSASISSHRQLIHYIFLCFSKMFGRSSHNPSVINH